MNVADECREEDNMEEQPWLTHDSQAVQKHLEIMQGVINRMAENSRSCKVWCVTLVAAILVLVARTGQADHALIALGPTALFYVLDAYYLSLERAFRKTYGSFVRKVHEGEVTVSDLYAVVPTGSIPKGTLWAMFRSFSVPPFYAVVLGTILLSWSLIFNNSSC